MELRINRTEQNQYVLHFGEKLIATSATLTDLMEMGESLGKKYKKSLMISASAVSDWYVGFPQNKEEAPEVFYDTQYLVKASAESFESPYRFVEGPFVTEEKAHEACFKISGKKGTTKE